MSIRGMRLAGAAVTGTAVLASVLAMAGPASAASRDGVCNAFEDVCMYQHENYQGGWYDLQGAGPGKAHGDANLANDRFFGTGSAVVSVNDNVSSIMNNSFYCDAKFYRHAGPDIYSFILQLTQGDAAQYLTRVVAWDSKKKDANDQISAVTWVC